MNVAEGRGRFATQLGAYNGYTAHLALDGDIPRHADTPPHCAQANSKDRAHVWWMVDLGKEYAIDSVIIHSSDGSASMLLHWS